jgi:retinol dehydrogenase 12
MLKWSLTELQHSVFHPAIYGAYTELWAGYSKEITREDSGKYVHPWGRFGGYRKPVEKAIALESEGGLGVASKFFDWSEKQVKPFA